MTRPVIACCAYPFGYGPASKLIVLARALRDRGWEPVFLGTGIAREFAARSDVFAQVVTAEPYGPETRGWLNVATALLSVMDRDFAAIACESGRPYFVVDSLLWMRDRVPDVFVSARRYWVQDFPGVRTRVAEIHPMPTVVGPIVAAISRAEPGANAGLVLNLGGMESPNGDAGGAMRYADFVLNGLLRSELLARFAGRATVLGGRRIIDYLTRRHGRTGLEFASLSHDESLGRLAEAAVVLTTPGLTATLECFRLAVPTFFLPPQSYSQWWSLHVLRRSGLARASFHWQDRLVESPIVERMPEAIRGPLLRGIIDRLVADEAAQAAYVDCLGAASATDWPALAARQRVFFDSLGPNGVEPIARELTELCG
jgi:UDP:flavonoid glycosyltransferase YjiC (YdhE family)